MNNKTIHQLDRSLIEQEYIHIQNTIESFDSKSLTIKAWSVSVVGLIAGSGAFLDNLLLLPFAAFVSLMFWLIDASWKTFQHAHYSRQRMIEEYMRGEREEISNFQIGTFWKESYKEARFKRYIRILFFFHILLPHGVMFFSLLAAYVVLHYELLHLG